MKETLVKKARIKKVRFDIYRLDLDSLSLVPVARNLRKKDCKRLANDLQSGCFLIPSDKSILEFSEVSCWEPSSFRKLGFSPQFSSK